MIKKSDKNHIVNASSSHSMVTILVNHSPSFSTDTPLDLAVKKKLILETLALVRVDAKQLRRGKAADKQLASERLLRAKGRATADQPPAVSLEEMQSIRSTAACIPAQQHQSAICSNAGLDDNRHHHHRQCVDAFWHAYCSFKVSRLSAKCE